MTWIDKDGIERFTKDEMKTQRLQRVAWAARRMYDEDGSMETFGVLVNALDALQEGDM